jgi:hypothetical protein
MAEEHNLIIEHLRALRSDMGEVKGSLRGIKEEMIGLRQHMGGFLTHESVQDEEIVTIKSRIERIEARLNIAD